MAIDYALLAVLDPAAVGVGRMRSDALRLTCWLDADGRYHCEDGPAVVTDDGVEEWHQRGELHRDDGGPAITRPLPRKLALIEPDLDNYGPPFGNGRPVRGDSKEAHATDEWWQHGRLHRIGAPAVVHADGLVEFWVDGVRHRAGDEPAVAFPRPYGRWGAGPDEYWVEGKLHHTSAAARRIFSGEGSRPTGLGRHALQGTLLDYDKWRVLRHYLPGVANYPLAPTNVNAWAMLKSNGWINTKDETIGQEGLELALAVHANL